MVIFLVIIGLMAGIALASHLYVKNHGTSQANRSNDPHKHWGDAGAGVDLDDFDAGADGD